VFELLTVHMVHGEEFESFPLAVFLTENILSDLQYTYTFCIKILNELSTARKLSLPLAIFF